MLNCKYPRFSKFFDKMKNEKSLLRLDDFRSSFCAQMKFREMKCLTSYSHNLSR